MTFAAAALALIVALAGVALVREHRAQRRDAVLLALLATFGGGLQRGKEEPRQLLIWEPLARMARQLFPEAFRVLDRAAGGRFPFSQETLQAAHARWTTEWLTWERDHDLAYKLKAADVERAMARAEPADAAALRERLHAIEREKLERYQERYTEYVKVSKALAALGETSQAVR